MTLDSGAIDFAHPETPWAFRVLNIAARSFAPALLSLAPGDLMRAAQRKTGLQDFADGRFREGLDVLARALDAEARLHPAGRLLARTQLVGLLVTRLRVADLLIRRPEIRDERVAAPIVILGLPRTGTTLLQRLIAQDPGIRSLPYWEALAPLPLSDAAQPPPAPDPRIKRAEQALRLLHWIAPAMLAMHEMEALAPDEEIFLLAVDFATMLFEASYHVPSYRRWYVTQDLTDSYRYLHTLLQVLQWYRRGECWVLKSPQHLEQLGPLLAAFPDATLVQTHRDPLKVTASVCSMTAYGRRMNTDDIDAREIGAYWACRLEEMLRRSSEGRPAAAARQFVDVQFGELMADPIGTVRRIYALAGRELGAGAEQAMRAFLAANPRGKHGAHNYRLEDFGLDAAERRAALRFYQRRFNVADE